MGKMKCLNKETNSEALILCPSLLFPPTPFPGPLVVSPILRIGHVKATKKLHIHTCCGPGPSRLVEVWKTICSRF